MKKVILIVSIVLSFALAFGCSFSSSDTNGSEFQRPTFIDTRPESVIEQNVSGEIVPAYSNAAAMRPRFTPTPLPDPITPPTSDPITPVNKYAFIIGISDYEGTINDLTYCDDDAIDWYNYFNTQGFTQIEMLLDMNATQANIQTKLEWLSNVAGENDEIVFCYSGHGTDTYNSSIISADLNYLTSSWVMGYINNSAAVKKGVFIDACLVGGFGSLCQTGTFMALASNDSYSYDGTSTMANGVWTYYMTESLFGTNYSGTYNGTVFAECATYDAEYQMITWGNAVRAKCTPWNIDNYSGGFDF